MAFNCGEKNYWDFKLINLHFLPVNTICILFTQNYFRASGHPKIKSLLFLSWFII